MSNHLAQSNSLYLRKHAENPIDWWPWGEAALALAKDRNCPIFLSIGYSSCHWCTVMEGEAFSDEAIAAYMNANFIAIKVDREERPDLDSIYMQALQMMIGQGGWPLNMVLTPDRVPFYGGTYFPLQPRYGRPGFLEVLQAVRRFYDSQPEDLQAMTQQMMAQLQQVSQLAPNAVTPAALRAGLDYSAGVLSASGPGPRFPMIPYAAAALRSVRFTDDRRYDAQALCQQRGQDLALGGIYDHIGGGFHRYTVDPTWTVPHFEKMLYDNGQIMAYLADLWGSGQRDPALREAIAGTVGWLDREMTAPAGYFYAAQDADSFTRADAPEPEEGAFYVWDYAELADLLMQEALAQLAEAFDISPNGNFEGRIVLRRRQGGELPPALRPILATLFQQRYGFPDAERAAPARTAAEAKGRSGPGRIPPVTDTKMIVAWNSLMISGLARAAAVFSEPDYYDRAEAAAQFILAHQWRDGRLHRLNYADQPSLLAQAEDYALLIKALLDLDQAAIAQGRSADWLTSAAQVQGEFDRWLGSDSGGYYNTAADDSDDLLIRERSYADSAIPAANGVAIANLVRLALLQEDLAYLDQAERSLQAFSMPLTSSPQSCPTLLGGLDWFHNHILLRTGPAAVAELGPQYWPTLACKIADLPEGAAGLVCQGLSCQAPALSHAEVLAQLEDSQRRCQGG